MGGMSYTIKVTASNGTVSVESSGDVPDGEHTVTGHEDPRQVNLSVTRVAPGGHLLQSATATQYRSA